VLIPKPQVKLFRASRSGWLCASLPNSFHDDIDFPVDTQPGVMKEL
jgi:hypothetical protein